MKVYKYDNSLLWDDEGKPLVEHDPLQYWLVLYRGQVNFVNAVKLEIVQYFSDFSPWVRVKTQDSRKGGLTL